MLQCICGLEDDHELKETATKNSKTQYSYGKKDEIEEKIDHSLHGAGCRKYGKPHKNDEIFQFDSQYFKKNNIDLQEVNNFQLKNFDLIHISSQGSYNNCVAQASAYCIEYAQLRKYSNEITRKASEMFIWYNARKLMSNHLNENDEYKKDLTKSNVGTFNRFGLIVCENKQFGIVEDDIYKPNNYNIKPSNECYKIAKKWMIDKCIYIKQNEDHIKQVLFKFHHPIMFGFHLYDGFRNNVDNDTGIIPLPTCYDKPNKDNGHCVVIVGFRTINNVKYFKIRNSWDIHWGINGYYK